VSRALAHGSANSSPATVNESARAAAAALLMLQIGIGLPDLLSRGMHRATHAPADQVPRGANWSSPTLGTSDGRPTISGSTGPTAVRSLRVKGRRCST
jgi:hypothetical protein